MLVSPANSAPIKSPQPPSLPEFARTAPLDANYAETFRTTGVHSVEHAIDTFFRPDRSSQEAFQAYDDLAQVQEAFQEANRRTAREIQSNQADGAAKAASLELPPDQSGELAFLPKEAPGSPVSGQFTTKFSHAELRGPKAPDLSSVDSMLKSLHEVLPLYAASVMAPGPLAVSLKTQLQQTRRGEASASSSSSSYHIEQGASLLPLAASARVSQESSSAHSSAQYSASSESIDQRVIPKLHELRDQLERLGMSEPVEGALYAVGVTTKWGKDDRHRSFRQEEETIAKLETHAFNPAHLALQTERQGAFSGLSQEASETPLGSQLADRMRTAGGESLRNAMATLFHPDRTVEDGRKAYDSLVDLARAFDILSQRQQTLVMETGKTVPNPALAKFSAAVDEAAPLFASVAMVPGGMESSVSKHPKEEERFHSESRSSSSGRVDGLKVQLLPLGYSSERGASSSASASQANAESVSTTTDEILVKQLHGLREQLSRLEGKDFDEAQKNATVFVNWSKGGFVRAHYGDGELRFA